MNRLTLQTAIWLDNATGVLKQIKNEAEHRKQCKYELGDTASNDVYANVKNILDKAIDEINKEFEKL